MELQTVVAMKDKQVMQLQLAMAGAKGAQVGGLGKRAGAEAMATVLRAELEKARRSFRG